MLNRNTENRMLFCIVGLLIGILLCGVVYFFKNDFQNIVVIGMQISISIFLVGAFLLITVTIYFITMNQRGNDLFISLKKLVDIFINYRYRIAAGIFILLVVLGINFSSLSTWESHTYEESHSIIFGEARSVRSDEWLVQTPWILSQYHENFPAVNENIRVDGQNMLFMSTKAPIEHISTIGNPYNWGYLFLPIEQGYSWHWILKLLLLLLISYEFLYIITKESRYVAFVGAFWIAFSPPIVWWFDTSIIELIIAFQVLFVAIYYYFRVKKIFYKIILAALIIIFALNFILDLYAPFQIVLGYTFLALLIYLLYKNRKNIMKMDIIIIAFIIIVISIIVAITIIPSLPDILIMLSTSYPGKRVFIGGGMRVYDFSRYLYNWALPFQIVPVATLQNNSFASAYITFIPACFILLFKSWKNKIKNNNDYLKIFIISYIIFSLWILFPFPEVLSKYTLLFLVTSQMGLMGVGLFGVYISCIVISQLNDKMILSKKQQTVFLSLLGCYFLLSLYQNQAISYLGVAGTIFGLITFIMTNYFFVSGKKKMVLFFICILSIFPSLFVNPINVGLAPILETSVAKDIQNVVKVDPEGLWMGYDSITLGDYILAQGGKVLNSVHYYPNDELWKKVSNNPKDYEIYNRFAHIQIVFNTQEKTKFELIGMDAIKITLNVEDIKKLNIKYVVSYNPLEEFNNQNVSFVKQSENENGTIFIYEVKYND